MGTWKTQRMLQVDPDELMRWNSKLCWPWDPPDVLIPSSPPHPPPCHGLPWVEAHRICAGKLEEWKFSWATDNCLKLFFRIKNELNQAEVMGLKDITVCIPSRCWLTEIFLGRVENKIPSLPSCWDFCPWSPCLQRTSLGRPLVPCCVDLLFPTGNKKSPQPSECSQNTFLNWKTTTRRTTTKTRKISSG